jgi:hypothetical protein
MSATREFDVKLNDFACYPYIRRSPCIRKTPRFLCNLFCSNSHLKPPYTSSTGTADILQTGIPHIAILPRLCQILLVFALSRNEYHNQRDSDGGAADLEVEGVSIPLPILQASWNRGVQSGLNRCADDDR